jgi:hypothetical protein
MGPESTINLQPYLDTLYYSFESSNGFEYFDPEFISGLLGNVDSKLGINFLNFFSSLEGWYSYYRFASDVDQPYQVFKKDTTIVIDSTTLPVRFELIGNRLADETINTAIGSFDCKKFLLERRLSYLVSIPPLPPFAIKILGVEETVWLAPENWKVKSYIPSTNVDLTIIGAQAFYIPGLETNIIIQITNVENDIAAVNNFELYQNYPNPFNPVTKIKFALPVSGIVNLSIYNSLGEKVETLTNQNYKVDYNQIEWKANKYSSGVYYFRIEMDNFSSVRKMLLIK